MNETSISHLSRQLCKFGLNPQEWLIREDQQHKDQFVLVNWQDPEFQFRGSVELRDQAQMHWSNLLLISI